MSVFVSIPKSSWLPRYVKVRRVTNNFCKLHTKRERLNKVAEHEKTEYLLNCSVRIYQRIIKLKYKAYRHLSMFSCHKHMCLYKRQTHVSNCCKFQLSSDIEKTLVLLQCTLTLAKQQRHHIAKLKSWYLDKVQDNRVAMSLCSLIYNNKQGINSANNLVSIMNIGNQFKFVSVNRTIIFNADRIAHTFKCLRG